MMMMMLLLLLLSLGATMVWSVPSQGVFYTAYDAALRQRNNALSR
jgi:hypothetical protein